MNSLALCVLPLLAPLTPMASIAADFRYDGNQVIRLEISVPDQTNVCARFAAEEMRRYCSRILQRDLDWTNVVTLSPDGACRLKLQLSATPAHSQGAPRDFRAPSGPDAFRIDTDSASLTITASNSAGLLYGVYHVLQQQGCSWLFPGAGGETIPRKESIVVTQTVPSHADFSMRGLAPVENLQRYSEQDVRDMMDWMARNRMNYFVAIVNYGWERLGKIVVEESRKRGIHVVGCLWSFELFLPLETGKAHPEYFAWFDGKRQVDYNVKRCASSPRAINLFVEKGIAWFREHPEVEEWIVIPNDGFHWCECDQCRHLLPKDQWAAFFTPLQQALAPALPNVRLQNFIYVTRYGLPEQIAPYKDPRLAHFFDVHQRNKWFSLRDPAASVDKGNREGEVDERARGRALNNYLADRLHDWRKSVPGSIWIFENLMLHGTYSLPVPNLRELGVDLRAAQTEGVQGYLFEAYLHGWNSFGSDLWALARLCWNAQANPHDLEQQYYHQLLGEQAGSLLTFYDQFRTNDLPTVRRCSNLYWLYCAPDAAERYAAAIRSIQTNPLNAAGRAWVNNQLQVVELMDLLQRAGGGGGGSVVGAATPTNVLNICEQALETGRSMDGVFLAYEQLRQLFLRTFRTDSLGFRPLLPDSFSPEVRELFSHQKLWDTLAEWESANRFPRDSLDPDRALRKTLHQAIENYRAIKN